MEKPSAFQWTEDSEPMKTFVYLAGLHNDFSPIVNM
jgi:hypothetical protein